MWEKNSLSIFINIYKTRTLNLSILKETNPEYSLEKTLILRKTEGKRREQQRMRQSGSITDSKNMDLSKLSETVKERGAWRAAVHEGHKASDTI